MKINKKIIYSSLILIVIFITTAVFFNLNKNKITENESLDLSTIVDNSWQKVDSRHDFWFPKNNIVVIKTVNSFYQKNNNEFSIFKDVENYSENSADINNLSQKLISQGFSLDKNTSGLFGKLDFNPYYLLNFKKNNTWCQIERLFEFTIEPNQFTNNGYSFACFDFDFEKSYSQQNYFYKLLPKDFQSKDYSVAINSVQKNSNGFIKINFDTKFDGGVYILDKNSKIICESKACCDDSSKGTKEIWDEDWCLNYQSIY